MAVCFSGSSTGDRVRRQGSQRTVVLVVVDRHNRVSARRCFFPESLKIPLSLMKRSTSKSIILQLKYQAQADYAKAVAEMKMQEADTVAAKHTAAAALAKHKAALQAAKEAELARQAAVQKA